MSEVHTNQPLGTPTWMDLGVPDLPAAREFYHSLFGWEYEIAPEEAGYYSTCLVRGKRVAALAANPDPAATDFWWNVYLATDDCDDTVRRVRDAGGTVVVEPMEVFDQGRMAVVTDSVGAQFGLWQGRAHFGAQLVNEPGTLVRNDLATAEAERARTFYSEVFGFTLDRNEDLPDFDFTFLRRPDGHEVAGIFGDPGASKAGWATTFEVADTDAVAERALAGGGKAGEPQDMVYGRIAQLSDPFGVEFSVITRAS